MITLKEAQELGILSQKDVEELEKGIEVTRCEWEGVPFQSELKDVVRIHKIGKICTSKDFVQDFKRRWLLLESVKTPDFEEQELKEYQEVYEQMLSMNYPWANFDREPRALPLATPDPTEEEVQFWQDTFKVFCEFDFDAARKRCKIDTNFQPYEEYGW